MKKKEMPISFEKTAIKVSIVAIVGNVVLSLFKLTAGAIAKSGAMISDAVHSAADMFGSIIVIVGIKFASKDSDKDHPYGHERFECVAAIVLSIFLLVCGLFIGRTALEKLKEGNGGSFAVPGVFALIAAIVSIAVKEGLYWYTKFYANRFESNVLKADAWHHRSDALSSTGALTGILGARMGYPLMDSVASLIISIFVIKAAYDIFKDAIGKMVDRSCNAETEKEMLECASEIEGIDEIKSIRTRVFGNRIYVEIAVCVDGEMPLKDSHKISKSVHDTIEQKFSKVKHILVRVVPSKKEEEEKETSED